MSNRKEGVLVTGKVGYIVKMLIVMVLVLGTPIIFFSSIGDNPLTVRTNETRNIAIVNEDIGAEKGEGEISFGNEVTSVLSSDSSFDWTVLSRSAAVNGLKNKQYDAIMYIPSDFSSNILTYENLTPVKAEFQFTIQDQLNAVNRESVLREIDNATARVNSSISTLYWSYVSQDLEGVRSKFDGILEKEIAFQNTMYAFYAPSSETLATEIERQKSMLEGIQSSLASNEEMTTSNTDQVQQFEQSLSAFVEYVEQYKQYQTEQQELLQQLQNDSMGMVTAAINEQNPRYMELRNYLKEQSDELSKNFGVLGTRMSDNNQTMAELSAYRIEQVAKQRDAFLAQRSNEENSQQSNLIQRLSELKGQLSDGSQEDPTLPEEPVEEVPDTEETPENPGEGEGELPGEEQSIDTERAKLAEVAATINEVQASLVGVNDPPVEQITLAIESLDALTGEINTVNENLRIIGERENPLEGTVEELRTQVAQLQQQVVDLQTRNQELTEKFREQYLDLFRNRLKPVLDEIEKKEEQIIQSSYLSDGQRGRLQGLFSREIVNKNPEVVMNYHATLVKFENAINSSLRNDKNYQAFMTQLNQVLGIKEEEQAILDELLLEMPEANERLTVLKDETATFFDGYQNNMQTMQDKINEELGSIQESADSVMQKMLSVIGEAPVQGNEALGGVSLVNNQQSISEGLLTMNDAINTIGESQSNVVSYTDELHGKVESVQQDANHLNEKWSENVETTQMYRDDIFSVLGNTFVDGQKNGQVYQYLANPLQANGEVAAKQEEKKVPPVVVLVIVLISSLLIGYFSYYFTHSPKSVRAAMFILLNLVVGLIISMYGMDIYPLAEQGAIQWTIFTTLLLTATALVVTISFSISRLVGWLASVGLVIFFISPLLALIAPNIGYEDPMSSVYLSIQYGPDTLFIPAVLLLTSIIVLLACIPLVIQYFKNRDKTNDDVENNEAS